jgi:hypothetical protein
MSGITRYGVYWAPEPDHPLWRAGCEWLGRDPSDPSFVTPPRRHTDEPRRYGFHATLKAPIALNEGTGLQVFLDAVQALARSTPRFDMPALEVRPLGGFVALRPKDPVPSGHPLRQLADLCVRELDIFRKPMPDLELNRRIASKKMTDAEISLMRRWGYAHVFDHWRFHMTLSDSFSDDAAGSAARQGMVDGATHHFAEALAAPLACESVCVFVEHGSGGDFTLDHRFPLAS